MAALATALSAVGLWDLRQTKSSVLRNYPVIGHLRFLFEWIRPEIRQYFLESDREAVPFSRAQRSLVYQRSKNESDKRPFGTLLDVHGAGYEWINHSLHPTALPTHDFRVTIGAGRAQPYAASVFNISAMSFGALSANVKESLGLAATALGTSTTTGDGGMTEEERKASKLLVYQVLPSRYGLNPDDLRRCDAIEVVVGVPAVLVAYIWLTERLVTLAPPAWARRIRPWLWIAPAQTITSPAR